MKLSYPLSLGDARRTRLARDVYRDVDQRVFSLGDMALSLATKSPPRAVLSTITAREAVMVMVFDKCNVEEPRWRS